MTWGHRVALVKARQLWEINTEVRAVVKNVIIGIFCMLLLVTAGSFAYVGYHNTKAHIRTENEKHKVEEEEARTQAPPTLREQWKEQSRQREKERLEKEKKARSEESGESGEAKRKESADVSEDVAHLVSDMYVVPSPNGDIAYEYDSNEEEHGIFLRPYVVEHKGTPSSPASLHLIAGYRGNEVLNFEKIAVKGGSGEKVLVFPAGSMKQEEKSGVTESWYDVPVSRGMEDAMQEIATAVNVKIEIVGHEQENKILSQMEIARFRNVLLLYDKLKD